MTRYSQELKDQIARRMMPPNSQPVAAISRETGICAPTLYAWKKQFRNEGHILPSTPSAPDRWDAKAKLAAVAQTLLMNEAERSTWCREHGVYIEQLDAWKQAFETMEPASTAASGREAAATHKRVRQLEKELLRKERALAEAAALLTLSKKARAIWGTDEDA